MKTKSNKQDAAISKRLLEHITARDLANFERNFPKNATGSKPLPEPSLYQDAGGGYNANLTYPQK
jgi:hypothetical protein